MEDEEEILDGEQIRQLCLTAALSMFEAMKGERLFKSAFGEAEFDNLPHWIAQSLLSIAIKTVNAYEAEKADLLEGIVEEHQQEVLHLKERTLIRYLKEPGKNLLLTMNPHEEDILLEHELMDDPASWFSDN